MDFVTKYGPWAVVAGASEGVGASVARQLGERGINVVLVARNQATLDEVAATVATKTRTISLDLSLPDATTRLVELTADLEVGLVVFNAGADPNHSRFLDQPIAVWESLVARNCLTVMATTHHYAGLMVGRGRGGVVLVTSGAAWAGGVYLATYGASKAFDLILAESLWAELRPLGVDVLSIVLGRTDTPAYRRIIGDEEVEGLADPDDVARDILDNLTQGPTFPPDPSPLGQLPRRQAVELMSQGAAASLNE